MRDGPIQEARSQEFKNSKMVRCETRRGIVSPSWIFDLLASWLLGISRLMGGFALLLSLLPAFADPAPEISNGSATGISLTGGFMTVNHLGESEKEAALRIGKLLSHQRTTDLFGISIRGPFTGLPPVVKQPVATPAQPDPVKQVAAAVNVSATLEKAVQELRVGAINLDSHQILVGSRSIREGDLLVLSFGGQQFIVWVQSVAANGVLFCDTDLQRHILKPFGFGPKELPRNSVWGISDINKLLNKDTRQ
jgi:hypothetical protein